MYGTCIFCSASLGRNEAIETFPVGSRVAFDAWRGRLWAVCARCGRWNLAPIEERWEAVEAADRLFTDTRSRVQSENIGLARLPDGTRLIRVGQALPGELAAWRYGGQLVSRRRQHFIAGGALIASGVTIAALGLPLIAAAGVPLGAVSSLANLTAIVQQRRDAARVVHVEAAATSPTGRELVVRRRDLYEAVVTQHDDQLALQLPSDAGRSGRWGRSGYGRSAEPDGLVLAGDAARNIVSRAMVTYNHRGGKANDVARAVQRIERAGGAEAFVRGVAGSGVAIVRASRQRLTPARPVSLRQIAGTFRGEVIPVQRYRSLRRDDRPRLNQADALALEMALHEEAERRALEGELAALQAAWREAEEIAAISDSL